MHKDLLKEYIKLLAEDEGGLGFDMGGDMGGPGGMSFGSQEDLMKVFVNPFLDVGKTVAGKTKELSQRAQTLAKVGFEAAMTTLLPFLASDYQQIFAQEKQELETIKSQYKDVYDSTWTAFKDNDVALTAFFYAPKAMITVGAIRNAPIVATKMLSVLTGGSMDQFLGKVAKFFKLGDTKKPLERDFGPGIAGESLVREMSEVPRKRERNTGRYAYSIEQLCQCGHELGMHTAERGRGKDGKLYQPCIAGDFGQPCDCECFKPAKIKKRVKESSLREDKQQKDVADVLMQKQLLDKIDSNPRVQEMQKETAKIVDETLAHILQQAQAVSKAQNLDQLEQALKKKVPAIENLKKLPENEKVSATQALLTSVKLSMKSFYVKSLKTQVDSALKAGVPQDHPFIVKYNSVIQKIQNI